MDTNEKTEIYLYETVFNISVANLSSLIKITLIVYIIYKFITYNKVFIQTHHFVALEYVQFLQ